MIPWAAGSDLDSCWTVGLFGAPRSRVVLLIPIRGSFKSVFAFICSRAASCCTGTSGRTLEVMCTTYCECTEGRNLISSLAHSGRREHYTCMATRVNRDNGVAGVRCEEMVILDIEVFEDSRTRKLLFSI